MGKRWVAGWMVAAAGLAGCSSDDLEPTEAFCVGFGNGATYVSSCTNCTLDRANATDRDLDTAANVVPDAGATTETFTLGATSLNDIAGGAVVGLWVTQPSTLTDFTTDIETFLNDAPVESLDLDPQTGNGVTRVADQGTPAQGFIGMRTTQAFDEVLITRTNEWNAGADPVYRVYEICSDGGAT